MLPTNPHALASLSLLERVRLCFFQKNQPVRHKPIRHKMPNKKYASNKGTGRKVRNAAYKNPAFQHLLENVLSTTLLVFVINSLLKE